MARPAMRWWHSARRRPAAFAAVLLLSAGAVLVSAITPMLLGAVDAVNLREQVAEAPFPEDGVSVTGATLEADDGLAGAQAAVYGVLDAATRGDLWSEPQIVSEPRVAPYLAGQGRDPVPVHLSVSPLDCGRIRLTAGRCPDTAQQLVLPTALARSTGWGVGTALAARLPDPTPPTFRPLADVRVVGIYDERSGLGALLADPSRLRQSAAPRANANVLVGPEHLSRLADAVDVVGAVRVARPVGPRDLPALRALVPAAQRAALTGEGASASTTVASRLPALLEGIGQQSSAAAVLVAPIGLEAVLLAWFALGAVVQRTARARAAEWGVGRMRGALVPRWLGLVFTEPLVAVALGAVAGFAAALAASRVVATLLLGTAGDVEPFTTAVLGVAGLAVVGSLVALGAASLRAALLPLPQLLQDTAEPRRLDRAALIVQVALVSIAVAVLWVALTAPGLGGQQLGLLLPAMLALVAGLLAVRVAVVLVRRLSRRAPRSLVGLAVGRGLARAPSALVAAQLVLVSAALAACALQLGLASAAVQTDHALLATGADRVLTVRVPLGTSLLAAVRHADPSGRVALAAEQIAGDGTSAGSTVLAVDTTRLAAVSTWRPAWRTGVDLARLHARLGQELRLRGTRLDLEVRGASTTNFEDPDSPQPPDVAVEAVIDGPDGWIRASLGTLRNGRMEAAIPCSTGCRLVALAFHDADPSPPSWGASATVTAISTDRQPASSFTPWLRGSRWRDRVSDLTDSTHPAHAGATTSGGGLLISAVDQRGPNTVQLEPAIGPAILPAVLGSQASLVPFAGFEDVVLGTALSDGPALLHPVGRAVALPRSLRTGVLVDLALAERDSDPAVSAAVPQVWLTAGEHAGVLTALRAQGVRVLTDQRATAAVDAGLRSATNRAVLVAGATAVAGIVFGLLALVAARIADMPERRREWRTLRLAGVTARASRRLALVQIAVPAVIGSLVGVVVGSLAATLIVGRLPLLVGVAPGPLLDPAPPLVPLALLALALAGSVVVAAVVLAAVEVRRTVR